MPSDASPLYVTTPIYYVNDVPHLGHAYTTVTCDAFARFARLDGREVMFLTGTDEHGQKVAKSAEAASSEPKAFTDRLSKRFLELVEVLDATPDDFIRTTEERHRLAVQALWQKLVEAGEIYLGKYEGWYSVRDEAYFTESELVKAEGGAFQAPTGAPVEWVEEPSYFFRLSHWQDRLLEHYERNSDFVLPESRRNEVMAFVRGGLEDLSVSRTSFRWGIPVPDDPDHVVYVWLDALTNYITAAGYPDEQKDSFRRFWPALHVVGKDILRFHAVYWPAFLMAAGLEPPARVFAHGWWTVEGKKMSKSEGRVVDPFALIEKYGLDQVRYFLLREVPFGNDGDFSHSAFLVRANADLANDYGNLAQRVLSLVHRNCEGRVPETGPATPEDENLMQAAQALPGVLRPLMERQRPNEALEAIWKVIRQANAYVDREAPWALAKTDSERGKAVLRVLLDVIRHVSVCASTFVPGGAGRILDQLSVPADKRTFAATTEPLLTGRELPLPKGVFPRIQDDGEE